MSVRNGVIKLSQLRAAQPSAANSQADEIVSVLYNRLTEAQHTERGGLCIHGPECSIRDQIARLEAKLDDALNVLSTKLQSFEDKLGGENMQSQMLSGPDGSAFNLRKSPPQPAAHTLLPAVLTFIIIASFIYFASFNKKTVSKKKNDGKIEVSKICRKNSLTTNPQALEFGVLLGALTISIKGSTVRMMVQVKLSDTVMAQFRPKDAGLSGTTILMLVPVNPSDTVMFSDDVVRTSG